MPTFLKINIISINYSLIILVLIELLVNVNRIIRLTGWTYEKFALVFGLLGFAMIALLVIFNFKLISTWLKRRKSAFWSTILWFPYSILFAYLIGEMFPITNPVDMGGPGDGLIILGLLFIFPFFTIIENLLATLK